jgi:hypothetical protein
MISTKAVVSGTWPSKTKALSCSAWIIHILVQSLPHHVYGKVELSFWLCIDCVHAHTFLVQCVVKLKLPLQGSKSGELFFVSKDGRYFIKTISAAEARKLIKVWCILSILYMYVCICVCVYIYISTQEAHQGTNLCKHVSTYAHGMIAMYSY